MQVATLFRETAKLLGASMDGSALENPKYCMKSENQADDGYETCVDLVCGSSNMERLLGGGVPSHLDPSLRHLTMDAMDSSHPLHHHQQQQHHHHHHQHQQQHHRQSMPALKMEHYGQDPYSFVDEMPNAIMPHPMGLNHVSTVKKRGRKKKPDLKDESGGGVNKSLRDDMTLKERKRHDRFNGLSEAEVSQKTLPDHLTSNLDIVIVGINPGLFAAFKGHHYAGPGNHFWKCLYMSGLVPEPLTAEDDYTLLHYGIGFTNMVSRPTKGSADLTRREIKQGSQILLEKLQKFQPKVAVFNGKLIYEVFSGKKEFPFGRQAELVEGTNTHIWVMPSSSARCAQLPRAADKVPFYQALKKFKDYLNGLISELDDSEITFMDSKSMVKGSPSASNGDAKPVLNTTGSSGLSGEEPSGYIQQSTGKKKRGRPRKGMEKQPPISKSKKEKKVHGEARSGDIESTSEYMKKEQPRYGGNFDPSDTSTNSRLQEAQRKRRGRPKKSKLVGSPPNSTLGSKTPPDTLETSTQNSIGTCQPQTASSVSSGYSTGTSVSTDERRREENGSLSNTGSGGPSPSHHSFTTQSDLSSEISAAISSGSPQPSPRNTNNQSDSGFDSLQGVTRGDHTSKMSAPNTNLHNSQTHSTQNCRPTGNSFNNSQQGHTNSLDSHPEAYSHLPYYDNRSNLNSNRPQPFQSPVNNQRDGLGDSSQMQGTQTYQGPYETKVIDVATKSLSGLESLVDQIPSIADAELPPVSNGCLGMTSDTVSQISHLGGVSNSMSHSNPYSGGGESGFLPYSHHGTTSSYGSTSHYATPPYYASELSPTFPVNSLGPTYCSPSAPSGIMFGYPGYHSQYTASSAGYPHPSGGGLHLGSGYGAPPGYSPYPNPSHYSHGHPMTPPSGTTPTQRFGQRLHLRQDGMDLGHMGYGGF